MWASAIIPYVRIKKTKSKYKVIQLHNDNYGNLRDV